MNLPQQARRQGEAFPQSRQAMLQARDITGDLHHIIKRTPWRFLQLKQQEIRER